MKSQRQAKIVEIIANRDVQTQEQLLEELRDAGFRTTQATISRDIKELRIVKEMAENGGYRYAVSNADPVATFSGRLRTISRSACWAMTMRRTSSLSAPCRVWPVRRLPPSMR